MGFGFAKEGQGGACSVGVGEGGLRCGEQGEDGSEFWGDLGRSGGGWGLG